MGYPGTKVKIEKFFRRSFCPSKSLFYRGLDILYHTNTKKGGCMAALDRTTLFEVTSFFATMVTLVWWPSHTSPRPVPWWMANVMSQSPSVTYSATCVPESGIQSKY